jgi:cytochrome c551/c552
LTAVKAADAAPTHHACMGRASILSMAALVAVGNAWGAEAPESMTHRRCYICHADHEARAGPAFADVAAAWRGEPDAVAAMARVIRSGAASGGPWHMPPHPEVSTREAQAMARYIMSLAQPATQREIKAGATKVVPARSER